jgi:hypothetical protein
MSVAAYLSDCSSQAIAFLQEGRLSEALKSFHAALKCVHEVILEDRMNLGVCEKTVVGAKEIPTTPCAHAHKYIHSVPLADNPMLTEGGESFPTNGFVRLYNRVIALSSEAARTESFLWQYHREVIAVLFFNMGLLYHQCGISSGDPATLGKGLQLYEMAVSVVSPDRQQDGGGISLGATVIGFDLLELALYSNICHIHSTKLDHVEEAKHYSTLLRDKLRATSVSQVDHEDYSLFCMNIFFFDSRKDLNTARAA